MKRVYRRLEVTAREARRYAMSYLLRSLSYVKRLMPHGPVSATVVRMPSVTFLGHAGLAIRAGGFRLLADPWFARTGAFLGSWHQFPRNDHLDVADLLDSDWV